MIDSPSAWNERHQSSDLIHQSMHNKTIDFSFIQITPTNTLRLKRLNALFERITDRRSMGIRADKLYNLILNTDCSQSTTARFQLILGIDIGRNCKSISHRSNTEISSIKSTKFRSVSRGHFIAMFENESSIFVSSLFTAEKLLRTQREVVLKRRRKSRLDYGDCKDVKNSSASTPIFKRSQNVADTDENNPINEATKDTKKEKKEKRKMKPRNGKKEDKIGMVIIAKIDDGYLSGMSDSTTLSSKKMYHNTMPIASVSVSNESEIETHTIPLKERSINIQAKYQTRSRQDSTKSSTVRTPNEKMCKKHTDKHQQNWRKTNFDSKISSSGPKESTGDQNLYFNKRVSYDHLSKADRPELIDLQVHERSGLGTTSKYLNHLNFSVRGFPCNQSVIIKDVMDPQECNDNLTLLAPFPFPLSTPYYLLTPFLHQFDGPNLNVPSQETIHDDTNSFQNASSMLKEGENEDTCKFLKIMMRSLQKFFLRENKTPLIALPEEQTE